MLPNATCFSQGETLCEQVGEPAQRSGSPTRFMFNSVMQIKCFLAYEYFLSQAAEKFHFCMNLKTV